MQAGSVKLRPIEDSDLQLLNQWKNDPAVYKYLGGGFQPTSLSQQREWMASLCTIDNRNQRFIIEFDQCPVGQVGLYSINQKNRNAEIGVFVGNHEYHGRGIASIAVQIIECYARNYMHLAKLKLFVVDKNKAGVSFWKKNGYETVGRLTKERYIDGSYCDVLIMEKMIGEF